MTQMPKEDSGRWNLVATNAVAIRDFLEWSARCEVTPGWSMRWRARPDIEEARAMIPLFDEPWWAVVVYSCFNSKVGALAAVSEFHSPVPPAVAEAAIELLCLPPGAVAMHRIQPGHRGAKLALLAACTGVDAFREILHKGVGFDDRYVRLRALNAASWGRTTCYDLLLRSGAIGAAGGLLYEPEYAYLGDSTGPRRGFSAIWSIPIDETNASSCEALLEWWSIHWDAVAVHVAAAARPQPAYGPADFENALCLYRRLLAVCGSWHASPGIPGSLGREWLGAPGNRCTDRA
jgi:hypothetical protein